MMNGKEVVEQILADAKTLSPEHQMTVGLSLFARGAKRSGKRLSEVEEVLVRQVRREYAQPTEGSAQRELLYLVLRFSSDGALEENDAFDKAKRAVVDAGFVSLADAQTATQLAQAIRTELESRGW